MGAAGGPGGATWGGGRAAFATNARWPEPQRWCARAVRAARRPAPPAGGGEGSDSEGEGGVEVGETLAPLLLHAALRGDAEEVASLLQGGAPVEARVRSSGATALALAAAAGHRDVVELLLQSGASAGARDGAGATALCVAALRGQLGAVEALVESQPPGAREALLEVCTHGGETALLGAVKAGHVEVVKYLLGQGADRAAAADSLGGVGAVGLACRKNRVDAALFLLGRHEEDLEAADAQGMRPLMHACCSGSATMVGALLALAPPPELEAQDAKGMTALLHAGLSGSAGLVQLLVRKGCKLEARDAAGNGLAWYVAASGSSEALAWLLKREMGFLNARNRKGRTPIFAAVKCRRPEAVREMIALGCSLEVHDDQGWTPLAWSAVNGLEDMADLLVGLGADLRAVDNDGHVPRQIAEGMGHRKTASLLAARAKQILTRLDGAEWERR